MLALLYGHYTILCDQCGEILEKPYVTPNGTFCNWICEDEATEDEELEAVLLRTLARG